MDGTLPVNLPITSIQTKSFVGGIEKSFLYDSIAKSAKREDQVDYVQRQAKKSEAEAVVKKLLAGGMSADEILEKLK